MSNTERTGFLSIVTPGSVTVQYLEIGKRQVIIITLRDARKIIGDIDNVRVSSMKHKLSLEFFEDYERQRIA